MRILYIANIRLPTEKAHGFQIMKTCAEFTKQGHAVTLVVAKRFNSCELKKQDPFSYYGIKQKFPLKKLFCIDLIFGSMHKIIGPLAFWLQSMTFIISLKLYLLKNKYDVIYCRDEPVLSAILNHGNLIYEAHKAPSEKYRRMLQKTQKIICITESIKKKIMEQGIASEKILVAPDAVDLEEFRVDISRAECQRKLKLPQNKKIVIYTGQLFSWKGVYVLAEATKYLPKNFLTVFVGGTDYDVKKFNGFIAENNLPNILVLGQKERKLIPNYLAAAEVAVLPNSGKSDISKFYTSPIKMFEYMAARRPIVAADLPSIREVLDESCAVMVRPDEPKSLAMGIIRAAEDGDGRRVAAAFNKVKEFSWEKRAQRILEFIR